MKAKKLAGSAVYSWLYPASTGWPPDHAPRSLPCDSFLDSRVGQKGMACFSGLPAYRYTLLLHGKRSCFHGRESRTVFHRQPFSAGRFGDRMKSVPGRRGRTPCRYGRFPPVGKWMKVYGFFRIPPAADTGIPVYGYR